MERQDSKRNLMLDTQSQGSLDESYDEIKDMLDESQSMISN